MKKTMMKAGPGLCIVLALLFTWACTSGPQNVNNVAPNQNANANAAAENSNKSVPLGNILSSSCSEDKIDKRLEEVAKAIKKDIEKSSLKTQYAAGKIKFQVVIAPGANADTLYLYIEGKMIGKDELETLAELLDGFLNAKCTSRVVFVRPGTIASKPGAAILTEPGFEWLACDYPNEPCPNGECRPPGTCPTGTPAVNVNTNTSTNTNTNRP